MNAQTMPPMTHRERQQVSEFLPLVIRIANAKYRNVKSPMAEHGDFVSVGAMAVLLAIRSHDPARGSLRSRVSAKIAYAMADYLREIDHLSRWDRKHGVNTKIVRLPESDESHQIASYDAEVHDQFEDLVVGLNQRERHVLYRHFIDQITQHEIAAEIGRSDMCVSQLIKRSLDKIRARLVAPETMAVE